MLLAERWIEEGLDDDDDDEEVADEEEAGSGVINWGSVEREGEEDGDEKRDVHERNPSLVLVFPPLLLRGVV